ncbi:tripartite tricarboxylate transporter substrate binding protein [Mesorhizobium sp. DCY119]|jgi:tripartite-type tricarboxylate transporter receptor subunit TctC|uniref:Bug family tripartite tricarboxylate transporter substrate binding protein n=1 Tax=Mesorhizobium sp. DCY119 TaxID=2108445 RepID=UPI000E6BB7A9|nr:tripartite tricarboxylate transporter substrate binding protein [Mesorhizobium sp. DCY119]RJG46064.1 tripartite tricarboxylate transporter substrate binding protein [Mesorhizobium sp. DCY119]
MKNMLMALASVVAVLTCSTAGAQTAFPTKPITLIVTSDAGGPVDSIARLLREGMSTELGQPVIVENRSSGGGTVAAAEVAHAAPDGYTLIIAAGSTIVYTPLMSKVDFDTIKDFEAVTLVATLAPVLVVNKELPVKTMADFVALAKSRPGELTYASAGSGSASHLAAELMKNLAGIDVLHIPYAGAAKAANALLANEVDAFFSGPLNALPYMKSGQFRALMVTDTKRQPMLPDVPSAPEAGLPDLEVVGIFGILAPKGTPKEILEQIHAAAVATLEMPAVKTQMANLGYTVPASGPDEFGSYLRDQITFWGPMIKKLGISLE